MEKKKESFRIRKITFARENYFSPVAGGEKEKYAEL
jgi:hypothetical protein